MFPQKYVLFFKKYLLKLLASKVACLDVACSVSGNLKFYKKKCDNNFK